MSYAKRLILGILCIQMIMPAPAQAIEFEKVKKFAWDYGIDVCTGVNFFYELTNPPSLRDIPARKLSQHNKEAGIKAALCLSIAGGMRKWVLPKLEWNQSTKWPTTIGLYLTMILCSYPESLGLDALQNIWFIRQERNRRKNLKKQKTANDIVKQ